VDAHGDAPRPHRGVRCLTLGRLPDGPKEERFKVPDTDRGWRGFHDWENVGLTGDVEFGERLVLWRCHGCAQERTVFEDVTPGDRGRCKQKDAPNAW
jgi:hypothetical protein